MTLQEFLEALKRANKKWEFSAPHALGGSNMLRCADGDCPVIAVALEQHVIDKDSTAATERGWWNGRWSSVAEYKLGLGYRLAAQIVDAADADYGTAYYRGEERPLYTTRLHLRALLEDACGLGMTPWR